MFVEVTPIAIENVYYKFYVILAVLNLCNAVVIWIFYPETKRLSLEELDFYFARTYGANLGRVRARADVESEMKVEDARMGKA
ncbi:hypothetical protein LTR85_010724 [Meristemomyces frigidus]|nr:hypothetical protein LTR85_010724 [Meristemomyces frigidus]